MSTLLWILGSTFVVSLIALIGILTLVVKEKVLNKILLTLVGFAAGALMGGAFLHLLPESYEKAGHGVACLFVLIGFIGLLVLFIVYMMRRVCPTCEIVEECHKSF